MRCAECLAEEPCDADGLCTYCAQLEPRNSVANFVVLPPEPNGPIMIRPIRYDGSLGKPRPKPLPWRGPRDVRP